MSARRRRPLSARLEKLAAALPQGDKRDDGIKRLLRIMRGDPNVQKDSLYCLIAWTTGLPHDEIAALDWEVRNENRLLVEAWRNENRGQSE